MLCMILVIIKHLKSNLDMRQNEFNSIAVALINYIPKAQKYIEAKNSLLNNDKKGREKIIKGFIEGIFLLKYF